MLKAGPSGNKKGCTFAVQPEVLIIYLKFYNIMKLNIPECSVKLNPEYSLQSDPEHSVQLFWGVSFFFPFFYDRVSAIHG